MIGLNPDHDFKQRPIRYAVAELVNPYSPLTGLGSASSFANVSNISIFGRGINVMPRCLASRSVKSRSSSWG